MSDKKSRWTWKILPKWKRKGGSGRGREHVRKKESPQSHEWSIEHQRLKEEKRNECKEYGRTKLLKITLAHVSWADTLYPTLLLMRGQLNKTGTKIPARVELCPRIIKTRVVISEKTHIHHGKRRHRPGPGEKPGAHRAGEGLTRRGRRRLGQEWAGRGEGRKGQGRCAPREWGRRWRRFNPIHAKGETARKKMQS